MSTAASTISFLLEQTEGTGLTARPMFGEYGLYCAGKFIGVVCDDALFVKPTTAGQALAPAAPLAAPYPGAKPHLQIDPDQWENAAALSALVRATAEALPAPEPRRRKHGTA